MENLSGYSKNYSRQHSQPVQPLALCEISQGACRAVRELIIKMRNELLIREGLIPFDEKTSAVDPVTPIDRAAEEFIRKYILSLRPDDGIIGEEFATVPTRSGVEWIIDPIDGTVNFLYGIPAYSTSIAAAYEGKIIAGSVIDISANILYFAFENGGSYRQEFSRSAHWIKNIPSSQSDFSLALLGTGFSYSAELRAKQIAIVTKFMPMVRDIRRIGSAALDLSSIACGKLDWYFEYGLKPWDYAAGAIIVEEAGACISNYSIYADLSVPYLVWSGGPDLQFAWEKFCAMHDIPELL